DTGVVVLSLTNQFGCDSIHTITTTLLQSDSTFENLTSCNPLDTGVVVLNLTNQFGCDSVHTITTTLNATSSSNQNIVACDSVEVLGNWYFASTNFNDTIIGGSVNGCDSVVIYSLTINNSVSTFENLTSFPTRRSSVLVLNLTNQFGCDSVHTITTTLNATSSSNQNIVACDSVEVLGNWYFASTNFNDT